jgi:hypothetical protein
MMLMLTAECIDTKRWRVIMFEWIERSIRDKIIKEIEDCIDYPEDDYERGLNRGMAIAVNIIKSKKK